MELATHPYRAQIRLLLATALGPVRLHGGDRDPQRDRHRRLRPQGAPRPRARRDPGVDHPVGVRLDPVAVRHRTARGVVGLVGPGRRPDRRRDDPGLRPRLPGDHGLDPAGHRRTGGAGHRRLVRLGRGHGPIRPGQRPPVGSPGRPGHLGHRRHPRRPLRDPHRQPGRRQGPARRRRGRPPRDDGRRLPRPGRPGPGRVVAAARRGPDPGVPRRVLADGVAVPRRLHADDRRAARQRAPHHPEPAVRDHRHRHLPAPELGLAPLGRLGRGTTVTLPRGVDRRHRLEPGDADLPALQVRRRLRRRAPPGCCWPWTTRCSSGC